jgi:general secretion pathway protein G
MLMKKGFTLVELLIVLIVLGIIAAVVVPTFQSYTRQAKEAIAKDHLRTLRAIIEIYAAKNGGVAPGYPNNNISEAPTEVAFKEQITITAAKESELKSSILGCPENPFSGKKAVKIIANLTPFPSGPTETGIYGWIYKPATKNIRLNSKGVDLEGVAYFKY